MSGWQIHKYKGIVSLKLNNDIPIPKIVSPTDVLVEVHTSSVNPLDVMMMGKKFLNSIFDCERLFLLHIRWLRFQTAEFATLANGKCRISTNTWAGVLWCREKQGKGSQ